MKRIIAVVVLLCSLIGSSTAAYMVWDITPLDPTIFPGGFTRSNAWSINNNKQILGEVWEDDNIPDQQVFAVWDFSDPDGWGVSHTMATEIPSMKLIWPNFWQINDNGQVCGGYTYACPGLDWDFMDRPLIYDIYTQTARDLGCLGDDEEDDPFLDYYQTCYSGGGLGINNAGTVVGFSLPSEINIWGARQVGLNQPTIWIGGAKPMDMGETNCQPTKINNNNLVIGMQPVGTPERAYKQSGQEFTILPLPPEYSGWASRALDLNDEDMIVGSTWGQGPSDSPKGILWHPEEGIVQLPCYPRYNWAIPYAINKHGMIVGKSNGAVVWIGEGNNYQVVSLNMCKAQTGWNLIEAKDISDDGWIVGLGEFNGKTMGFLARPRLDENPPLANLDAENVENEGGHVTIAVLYYDDNGMNESTMDDKDIQVIYPDGTKVAAEFESVEELEPELETGKRKYRAQYSFSTPPMNPMSAEGSIIRILVAESEVSDLSGRYVPKGQIGELELTLPMSTVTILKGSTLDMQTGTTTWTFQTRLYSIPDNILFQTLGVKFQAPGSSAWQTMTSIADGIWSYSQTAASASGLNAFGNGDYAFVVTIDFGGPLEMEQSVRFGIDEQGRTIPAPTTISSITAPQQGSMISHKKINLNWSQPSDPAITSIICSVVDIATGNEVFNKVILNGSETTAGTATLLPDRNYRMTVYFCGGDQNRPEEDDWASYTLQYAATTLEFATLPYAGDMNDDGIVDLSDLAILSASWKKTSGQPGWNAQYDLQPNGTIDLGDLLILAQNWLQ